MTRSRRMPQVPAHKVKLFVGPGGEKIKWIQRKSKCRVQVRVCAAQCSSQVRFSMSYGLSTALDPACTATEGHRPHRHAWYNGNALG